MDDNKLSFDEKKEFIYKALDDATNTLRFIDTKVAAIFVVIGIYFTILSSLSDKIYQIYKLYSGVPFQSVIIGVITCITVVAAAISVYYGFRTLHAKHNPMNYVSLEGEGCKELWYLVNGNDGKITISLRSYQNDINSITEEEFLKIITLELMKVSGIRNIKILNSNKSMKFLGISLYSFTILISYIMYFFSVYKF
ncbi:hypothetical protein JOC70_003572 [Clostridium pascui]|uniref:hypothetical protein n=1 Tax=Clostridium pascui TaxID=46609 RepID=UPI00195C2B8E|nr:hypothetical protein [Clostridium pascui]MBM7872024.1 hypothetical protein [Clostridium pascui]